ncbi:DDE-type integrase/transposase/recombinase [Haloferax sp. KTX1]|uniref:DDE-type integrase/transposase/recombinase n=1 Tax=Haloferax sp. KTX1 TaxID=2600597 RepID=UPI0034E0DFE2
MYDAINLDTKVILDVALFKRMELTRRLRFSTESVRSMTVQRRCFLADSFGYRTAFSRLRLNGRVDYTDRNLIEKWFHTFKMRVDRVHNS